MSTFRMATTRTITITPSSTNRTRPTRRHGHCPTALLICYYAALRRAEQGEQQEADVRTKAFSFGSALYTTQEYDVNHGPVDDASARRDRLCCARRVSQQNCKFRSFREGTSKQSKLNLWSGKTRFLTKRLDRQELLGLTHSPSSQPLTQGAQRIPDRPLDSRGVTKFVPAANRQPTRSTRVSLPFPSPSAAGLRVIGGQLAMRVSMPMMRATKPSCGGYQRSGHHSRNCVFRVGHGKGRAA